MKANFTKQSVAGFTRVLSALIAVGIGGSAVAQSLVATANTGNVYVYRYKELLGKAAEPTVYCDEMQLAKMDNGRFFIAVLPAGTHVFRSNKKRSGVAFDIKPGQNYYIRVDMVNGFFSPYEQLVKVDPEQGSYEIKQLRPLDPNKIKNPMLAVAREATGGDMQTSANEVLTNQNVMSLKAAGLSDETIIAKIRTSDNRFSLTTQDLIELKSAHISEAVIKALIDSVEKR